MTRLLYSLLLYLLLPLLLLRAAWRGRRSPVGGERLGERLGRVPPDDRRPVLVHCVSVGETMAALPLLRALRERGLPLWVTSTTLTGAERVRVEFGDDVRRSFLPVDTPGAVARFLDRVQPRALLVMETEIWPNLVLACRARGIPVCLVNARLSAKSARGYRRFAALTRRVLASFSGIFAQAEADAARFRELGAAAVVVTGNLKFDFVPAAAMVQRAAALRTGWGGRPVWIAASTHEGEDGIVLAAHRQLRARFPTLLLVLVPRHPERFAAVATLVAREGFACARRSTGDAVVAATAVYLGDTMGELSLLYAAADVAFVGGSFSATGGHNILEPAALGLPVVTGPSVFNFQQAVDALAAAGALQVVAAPELLAGAVSGWLADADRRRQDGLAGQAVVGASRGALARTLAALAPSLATGAQP